MLISLRRCSGWSVSLLFTCSKKWVFSRHGPFNECVQSDNPVDRTATCNHAGLILMQHARCLPNSSSIASNHFKYIWAPPSEFVSSSIPSLQILTAHAQPFRGARDLAFCLKVPLDSLLVWASSEGSGETARMRRLAWTFAARIGDKYQIRLTRSIFL